jgi:hypothetical protein
VCVFVNPTGPTRTRGRFSYPSPFLPRRQSRLSPGQGDKGHDRHPAFEGRSPWERLATHADPDGLTFSVAGSLTKGRLAAEHSINDKAIKEESFEVIWIARGVTVARPAQPGRREGVD